MPSSISVVNGGVIKEATRIRIRFSDGSEREYASAADVAAVGQTVDSDIDRLKDMMVALWAGRSPQLNPNAIEGKTMTFNLSSTPPLTFT